MHFFPAWQNLKLLQQMVEEGASGLLGEYVKGKDQKLDLVFWNWSVNCIFTDFLKLF